MNDELEKDEDYQDPKKNPQIVGGEAAAKQEEQKAKDQLQSPEVNPLMPGAEPIDTEVSLEKQMAKHDALMVGGYVLVKEQPGKFSLISPDGQKAEVSLIEVEKFRDSPDDLKDLFSK